MALINVKEMAKAIHLDKRSVQRLVKDSGMPRAKKGLYDKDKCTFWYVCFLQRSLEKRAVPTGDGNYSGLTDERVRSVRADAEMKEIELAEKRGELVPIRQVMKVFVDLVHMTKARVMATPPRIAPEIMGETSRVMIQAIVEKQLKAALNHLADDGSNYTLPAQK